MKTFFVAAPLLAIASPTMASDAVHIPSGTYLEFPDPEGQPLSFDGDGTYEMGRYGSCTIIKKSVKKINYDFYSFDANCVNTHGNDFVSHEKWQLKRAENGDTYLVTISDSHGASYSMTATIAIWKLMTLTT
jgi:hypothetical protein